MRFPHLAALLTLLALTGGVRAQEVPDPAPAQEFSPLAVIHETTGQASVIMAGDPGSIPAEEDMELGPGDRVITGASGSITIAMRDLHFLKLGGQAVFTVKELRSDQVTGGLWARLELNRGQVMAVVASLTGPDSRIEIETPTAVAAVKGTCFQVSAGRKTTGISVLEGSVAASGARNASITPEELEVKEGFETFVDAKTRRPGALMKFTRNEGRKKARVALSEFRARMVRLRARGISGELRRQRRLRVLSRAMLIERFQRKNPQAYKALPEWRRARIDRFLSGHKPELDSSRAEISRFLASNPRTKKLLEQQSNRRFSAPRGGAGPRSGKSSGGKIPSAKNRRPTARQSP